MRGCVVAVTRLRRTRDPASLRPVTRIFLVGFPHAFRRWPLSQMKPVLWGEGSLVILAPACSLGKRGRRGEKALPAHTDSSTFKPPFISLLFSILLPSRQRGLFPELNSKPDSRPGPRAVYAQ